MPSVDIDYEDQKYAKGFILGKLYHLRLFAKRDNARHGGHTEIFNIPKGYPPRYKGLILDLCDEMDGILIVIFKSNGQDHVSALNDDEAIKEGLEICNYWREKSGLKPYNRRFEEIKSPTAIDTQKENSAKEFKKLTDKEKRALAYKKQNEKWMKCRNS